MLRFSGYLLRFHLASDWWQNNKHSRNFLWCAQFYGKDCKLRVISKKFQMQEVQNPIHKKLQEVMSPTANHKDSQEVYSSWLNQQ